MSPTSSLTMPSTTSNIVRKTSRSASWCITRLLIDYFTDDADVDYYELYDLKNDPNELHNIYGKEGMEKVERELKKKLAAYRKDLQVDE